MIAMIDILVARIVLDNDKDLLLSLGRHIVVFQRQNINNEDRVLMRHQVIRLGRAIITNDFDKLKS